MCRHVCPIGNSTGHERCTARARAFAISMVARGATELSEVKDNIYECSLCGACTNNCVTGFDPKVFVQEVKREVVLAGLTPDYVMELLEKYAKYGNVYGKELPDDLRALASADSDTLFLPGIDSSVVAPECVTKALSLIRGADGVAFDPTIDTGYSLWFLTGKTLETQKAAEKCAHTINKYKTVVVYDPSDLAFIRHEYKEWGIDVASEVISFNDYLLSLVKSGKIKVNKGDRIYTLQDNFAYARDLDDVNSGRELISLVGESRDMLLVGKEANLAGHSIMNEYMPEVMKLVARDRWTGACNMDCKTLVTESVSEYKALSATVPEGYRVITVEEMILENM